MDDDRVGQWVTYSEFGGKRFRFKTKVIDASSQINLNGRQDTLARMLDNLGRAIEGSERMKREPGRLVTNPFYTRPNRGGQLVRGRDILLFRQRLEGQTFQSKSQLRQLIGQQNYDLVKDFLTCWSWEDPYTYRASDGANEVPDLASGLTSVAGGGGGLGGAGASAQPPASENPRIEEEPRHPINVNTAPEEVLIACLQGIAGRRVFPFANIGIAGGILESIDTRAQILGRRLPIGQEEVRNVTPRAIYAYSQPIDAGIAKRLAQRIITQRKEPSKVFRAWRTNDVLQPGFEDFVDQLEDSFFPPPSTAQFVDPANPVNRSIQGSIIGGGAASPIARLWIKGNVQGTTRTIYRSKALPVHDRNAWYYEMMKGILKANFNPNTRINRYNPNAPAFIPVDKSDLVWLETRATLKKGHTTDFCFDSMGIYEVTTLGEMLDLSRLRGRRTAVGSGGDTASSEGTFPFRRQIRTVVQVFDVLRHTSQFHFERTFVQGARSSKNDRRYVVTWPEPMAALTELYGQGSRRDGRVELAGQLDGLRLTVPFSSRFTNATSQVPGSVLMTHSFMLRDSAASLRQAMQGGGGILGEPVTNALRDVLDANYCRLDPTRNRKHYRQAEMSALGVFAGSEARWLDPVVNREELGTDLYPDGLHTSILRMPHIGSRLLVLPARQRIGEISGAGGNTKVGASGRGTRTQNELGNVPYHRGGIAFWVKFEFNGDDPVFSGLVGSTQVIREVMPNASDFSGSEGSQFYIFKNSVGQLRVVRMYYHQAFPEFGAGGGDGGGAAGGGIVLYPDAGGSGANAADPNNPILQELDEFKAVSRSDVLIDISYFRAHEWHHVGIEWNDRNVSRPMRVFIDFEERQDGALGIPQQIQDGTANSWTRLNERQPRDSLMIGGIVRNQGVDDSGIFKWFTNTTTAPGGRGVQVVSPSIKRILANATIDELITFGNTFEEAKTYYGGRGQPGYFTNQTGEYANIFEIPLPPEVSQVTLRALDWTSYYPTTFTDSKVNSVPQALNVTPMLCEVSFMGPSQPRQAREPWREPTVDNFVAGKVVVRPETGIRGQNAVVVYKFRMSGARSPQGATAGGVVQTPVLDDVTLSYFLPSPKILLQEEDK
jgi:hypothetical protein